MKYCETDNRCLSGFFQFKDSSPTPYDISKEAFKTLLGYVKTSSLSCQQRKKGIDDIHSAWIWSSLDFDYIILAGEISLLMRP